jgi:membrane fusion protein (multidrug efflux system)
VSERLVQPGEYIAQNTQVVTIVKMDPLKLKTSIQEKHASLIKPGQPVKFIVEAFPDRPFTGTIAYVSPAVDQTTRTFVVEAMVDNKSRELKPGFFAKGQVETRVDHDVMAAPEDAVSTLAGVSTVYVVEGGKVRQQQVTLGERQNKLIEITSGLKGPEILATNNLNLLATGVEVRVAAGPDAEAESLPAHGSRMGGAHGGRAQGGRK